jgi:integrase
MEEIIGNKVAIYKLNDGYFLTDYIDPTTKKRRRHRFKTKKEARAYKEQLFTKLLPDNVPYRDCTVEFMMRIHFEKCPNTQVRKVIHIYAKFMNEFKHFKVRDIKTSDMRAFFLNLQEKHDYSETTLKNMKCGINHFFRFLCEEEVLLKNPLDDLIFDPNPPPRRKRIVLEPHELKQIMEAAKTFFAPAYFYGFLYTVLHTGARKGEIQNLKWSDIDFEKNLMTFRNTKNGDDRSIKMSRPLFDYLSKYPRIAEYVFVSTRHEPVGRSGLHRLLNRFKEYNPQINQEFSYHDLRHSFAYNFLKAGGQMYQLQAILGHKNIDMTVDLYGQLRSEDIENPSPYTI